MLHLSATKRIITSGAEKIGLKMVETRRDMNKYYSMKEAAGVLGVTRSAMYYLKLAGKIKVKKIGAQMVVTSQELKRVKAERQGDGHE